MYYLLYIPIIRCSALDTVPYFEFILVDIVGCWMGLCCVTIIHNSTTC